MYPHTLKISHARIFMTKIVIFHVKQKTHSISDEMMTDREMRFFLPCHLSLFAYFPSVIVIFAMKSGWTKKTA
jgi:hypothetical protein